MEKTFKKWMSPSLGRKMEMIVYGHSGTPVLALPTRGKKCDQWEEEGMIDSISFQIENGFNQIYCIDSIDEECLFNEKIDPTKRILRLEQFETYVMDEVVPFIGEHNPIEYLICAGVDMGGYHTVKLALKYPNEFGKAIGLSGVYDIRDLMDGYYGDDVYYNNPMDFVPNMNTQSLLDKIRDVDFRLVSFTDDPRQDQAVRLADILRMKIIDANLDIWDMDAGDEWELWRQMLKIHIV